MSTVYSSIDQHPDLLALRAGYGRTAESAVIQGALGLALLTGLYIAISPWVIGFDGTSRLVVINLIGGIAAAVLAVGFSSAFDRTHGMTWTMPLLGIWQIIAPWVHRGPLPTAGMVWSNVVSGALITVLGIVVVTYVARVRSSIPR
ncbi:MAG TPA: SPW repeat protein [Mycobacterium sp.]|jgi:hypothetical protein|nr:SPW repeat protein [Mycobacterium sp.]